MEEALKDLTNLIGKEDRPDLQVITLDNILALSGSPDGLKLIAQQELVNKIISLLGNKLATIKRTSALILVNVSAYEDGPDLLLYDADKFVGTLIENIVDPSSEIADSACMILSNITRSSKHLKRIVQSLKDIGRILEVFTKNKHNNNGHNLYYLGPVFSNLSQSATMRKWLLNRNECVVQKLLPFTEFNDSVVKRGGVVGTLRNCCFETDCHEWLLSDDVDILPRLLLPLAGNDEFDDEDNDKLPLDLQYLPGDKTRESDPDIRCMLLEAITLLCTLRKNREFVRSCNAYVVLRELHKWEKDRKALLACENLVDILIRTEEEIDRDNLRDADVPDDLVKKFERMDRDFLQDG